MNTIEITALPVELQEKVKSHLTAYNEAIVERQNGKFEYKSGHCLDTTEKADDFAIFTFTPDDVFTKEEQLKSAEELSKAFQKMNVSDSFWN